MPKLTTSTITDYFTFEHRCRSDSEQHYHNKPVLEYIYHALYYIAIISPTQEGQSYPVGNVEHRVIGLLVATVAGEVEIFAELAEVVSGQGKK